MVWLIAAAALRFNAMADALPEAQKLVVDSANQTRGFLETASPFEESLGGSPLSQLSQSRWPIHQGYHQFLDKNYLLQSQPAFALSNFRPAPGSEPDPRAFKKAARFFIQFLPSFWQYFTYNGSEYRWRALLTAGSSWENVVLDYENRFDSSHDRDQTYDAWYSSAIQDHFKAGPLVVTHRAVVEKKSANGWVVSPERFGASATGTLKRDFWEPWLRFTWHAHLFSLMSASGKPVAVSGRETFTYSGELPCDMEIIAILTKPNSSEAAHKVLFANRHVFSWNNEKIERPLSPDTKSYLFRLWRAELK